jgi:hypothetical protein
MAARDIGTPHEEAEDIIRWVLGRAVPMAISE